MRAGRDCDSVTRFECEERDFALSLEAEPSSLTQSSQLDQDSPSKGAWEGRPK